jgi:RNA polymerase sigma-70 factor (ECF subfamily)
MALSAQQLQLSDSSFHRALLARATTMDFDTFYRHEFTAMVGLARAICGDHQQAEDLAQEAMSRAHRHWGKVSAYERPGAWLRRVTINLALSRKRRVVRELAVLRRTAQDHRIVVADPGETGPDADVWDAVRALPPKQRAAIALFYQEDQSTADIAEILGCTVSTATSHLSQARARLAELLDEPAQNQAQREMTEDGRP